jgi:hypothetical protein
MSAFQKRETKREVTILGQGYSVDFGKDATVLIFKKVQEELEKIGEKDRGNLGRTERFHEMQSEEKAVLKSAIGKILDCPYGVQGIFQGDDTIILHRDISVYYTHSEPTRPLYIS